jgi:putative pyruvate formate lyase activating enzyme
VREPSYIRLHENGILADRIEKSLNSLSECRLCPRDCGADRLKSATGFCRTGRFARVASYGPHFGEEAPLVGINGSGTIFFSSCNLLCSFCQNYGISHGNIGKEVTSSELASIMLELQAAGCHNINFVTPSHVLPQILEALPEAVEKGLGIPLVYNTGGYDSVAALKLLDGIIDIYMPDFKFWDNDNARRYCNAGNYRQTVCSALIEMQSQAGELTTENGIADRGIILRHLIMPDGIAGTGEIMSFIAEKISKNTYINIMNQYRSCFGTSKDSIANRPVTREEYSYALQTAVLAGLSRIDGCGSI